MDTRNKIQCPFCKKVVTYQETLVFDINLKKYQRDELIQDEVGKLYMEHLEKCPEREKHNEKSMGNKL